MESYVVVRLPSTGTVFGEVVRDHPGSRVTSIQLSSTDDELTLLALVEGLPEPAVAQALLGWNLRYGRPAHVLGDAHALRLPLDPRATPAAMAELLRTQGLHVAGNVLGDGWAEQWIVCPDVRSAERLSAELALRLETWPGVEVRLGRPRPHDAECWGVLRMAAEVEGAA
jgi:hypothetical protein